MKDNSIKCSFFEHKESHAICYCMNCNIYMCNKCENSHSKLYKDHWTNNFDNSSDIFTGYCEKKNHSILEFYCKTHNQLCCSSCICKIKDELYGQHTDCDVCKIREIKEIKKNKLTENLKNLEDISNKINESIKTIKVIYQKVNEEKEELKLKIQKIFTKIRNVLNEREDEILKEIDNEFDNKLFNEDIIKNIEQLPNKIKISLEKGKLINNKWNEDNKLNIIINDCINIEKNIETINKINENIKKYNNNNYISNIKFDPDETKIDLYLNKIRKFGTIYEGYLINSKIINDEECNIIKNWVNPNKNIKLELLYRLSDNGEEFSKFHELCDNKGPTLTLFHIKDGNKVGIYTPLSFDNKSQWKSDYETFIFNLNQNKKYKKAREKDSLYCCKSYGAYTDYFGCDSDCKTMRKIIHHSNIYNSYEKGREILPSNSQTKYYDLLETEVFKISIEDKF